MHSIDDNGMWSRERLAGYDPDVLRHACLADVGNGAGGNGLVLNTSVSGVGEHRCIDNDTVERSNVTRSIFFKPERLAGGKTRYKARELAIGALALSYADDPIVRYAAAKVEALGLGALEGSTVVVSAVDNLVTRAWLARATRLLRIPFVELGFNASQGHISVYPNKAEDEPCWSCAHPSADPGGISCTTYARAVVAQGMTPATHTVAAVVGALAAEACIQAMHGEFPLGGKLLTIDIRTGKTHLVNLSLDRDCPAGHRVLTRVDDLSVSADEPPRKVFEMVKNTVKSPIIHLPSPFAIEAPCVDCGAKVAIMKPNYAVGEAPRCRKCADARPRSPALLNSVSHVAPDSRLAAMRLRRLGLGPRAIFDVEDAATGELHTFRLAGTIDDIYTTLRRKERQVSDTSPDAPSRVDAATDEADAAPDAVLQAADEHIPSF